MIVADFGEDGELREHQLGFSIPALYSGIPRSSRRCFEFVSLLIAVSLLCMLVFLHFFFVFSNPCAVSLSSALEGAEPWHVLCLHIYDPNIVGKEVTIRGIC